MTDTLERSSPAFAAECDALHSSGLAVEHQLKVATFVYVRLQDFNAVCETLSGQALAPFMADARRCLSQPALELGGEIAQRKPDSVLAVFSDEPSCRKPSHAQRGLRAAVLTVFEAVQLACRTQGEAPHATGPRLTVAVGVHLGEVERQVGACGTKGIRVVGEAVEIARMLEVTATDLHWSIAASGRAFRAAGRRAQGGEIGSVGAPDGTFLDITEVTGLLPGPGSTTQPAIYDMLREAVAKNSAAHGRRLRPARSAPLSAGASWMLVQGYRVVRKIAEGGMASIFLARSGSDGELQVLKIIPLEKLADGDLLQRFIQEYALLGEVRHPNVARFHRQGFSAGHAYIAMEYFPGGDLGARLARGMDPATAISYLRQAAAGLDACHTAGIVHRDIKPSNLMLRSDGSLALADFGIAKQVVTPLMDTAHGSLIGTPTYLSPEQARSDPVDARSDLYSLGVLAFRMLTGELPYQARTAEELVQLHASAPVPKLPAHLALYQPLIDQLMAKEREERYPSSQALLDDLTRRGL